jgi:very-short-patch-repair endonuclease
MTEEVEAAPHRAELESLRRRLLDLTARNRLLSYKHPKGRSVRLVQTDPAWLYDRLLSGQSVRIAYVPRPPSGPELARVWPDWVEQNGEDVRPKAKEWAGFKGIDTSYNLHGFFKTEQGGGSGRRGAHAQALYYPEDLERQLGRMSQLARTAIEDSGANILYLAFGFLEWKDRSDTSSHLAPLLLVPVTLQGHEYDSDTRRKIYTVTYSGEDVQYNLSLQEKLRREFDLDLPVLEEDDDLESYSAKCEKLRRSKPEWKIHAYVTLGFFQFGKLLLYLDLDPDRWPVNQKIDRHPLVSKLLGGSEREQGYDYKGLHDPDAVTPDQPEFQLVHRADSSQHSAVIDAANGEDLVIEGPPGTGKSQTIANIIGVALRKKQSVLFVSEKMAALEVVRSRLADAGLGDFCLELHSHRTQRTKLLEDLRQRVERGGDGVGRPGELRDEVRRFQRTRDELNEYARAINGSVPGFNLTVHHLFWLISERSHGGVADPEIAEGAPTQREWSQERLDEAFGRIDRILARRRLVAEEVTPILEHPLCGLSLTPDASDDWNAFAQLIEVVLARLEGVLAAARVLGGFVRAEVPETIEQLSELQILARKMPAPQDDDEKISLDAVTASSDTAARFRACVRQERQLASAKAEAESIWARAVLEDSARLRECIDVLRGLGNGMFSAGTLSADQIERVGRSADGLADLFGTIVPDVASLESRVGFEFPGGAAGLHAVDEFFDLAAEAPPDGLALREPAIESLEDSSALDALAQEQRRLCDEKARLDLRFATDEVGDPATLEFAAGVLAKKGMLLGVFDAEWRAANGRYRSLCRQRPLLRSGVRRAGDLRALAEFARSRREFEGSREFSGLLGEGFRGLDTPVDEYQSLIRWQATVREWVRRWFSHAPAVSRAVLRADEEVLQEVLNLDRGGARQRVQQASWYLGQMQEVATGLLPHDWFGDRSAAADSARRLADNLLEALPVMRDAIPAEGSTPDKAVAIVRPYVKVLQDTERKEGRSAWMRGGTSGVTLPEANLAAAERAADLAETLWGTGVSPECRSVLTDRTENTTVADVLTAVKEIDKELDKYGQETADAIRRLGVESSFCGQALADTPLETAVSRFRTASDAETLFPTWRDFAVMLHPSGEPPVPWESLAGALMTGRLSDDQARATAELGLCSRIADDLVNRFPVLREFEGTSHEEVQQRLRQVDKRLTDLHRLEIADAAMEHMPPSGNSAGRVKDFTEMGLLQHEMGKKKRHASIRRLTKKAGRSLKALKPCFMMGPLSVAQYLPPGELEFDLVIMDEASQMKPEDAIGALARGKQAVVVGDPRQLPPTSFFDRLEDDEETDEDNETIVQGKESVLDLMMPALGRARQLNWHYRSQHEALIAFSNEHFYEDRLQVFPSPKGQDARGELGVTYRYVQGTYGNQRNHEEAQELLRGVLREVRRSGGQRSIGVVAVNSQQAELLHDEWARIVREHPDVEGLMDQWNDTQQPFFIKNLENVQGDERDVIFISLTYGPDKHGHVYQRFGPINQRNGWRRLNVLFTRAKQNMVVYTSMRSEQVTPAAGNRGATALKEFLDYCERGGRPRDRGSVTGREPDSPFEIEVIRELSAHGYEGVPQVGVAGFFIDIGVRHPELPEEFVLGVECDGATYHSARSARDRDHLRQEILEGLGWRIHRIWSVEWYRRRDREVRRLLEAVDAAFQAALRDREERDRHEAMSSQRRHIPRAERAQKAQSQETGRAESPAETRKVSRGQPESPGQPEAGEPAARSVSLATDDSEELETSLHRLRETIEEEFPDVPRERGLLREDVIRFLVDERPTTREDFGRVIPPQIRQSIDVGQARNYLSAVLSLCEEFV